MTDPFPASEFDEWAESYDASVSADQFPFYAYKKVLTRTAKLARAQAGMSVLDLGTGTGNLARLLVRRGCELWCTDFSEAMLAKARQKLPQAHFSHHDLRRGWPAGFPGRFDRIVSAYVFHHFDLDEKVRIIYGLLREHLSPLGRLVIADVAFPDRRTREKVKEELGNDWEEEYYWVADDAIPAFKQMGVAVEVEQVSVSEAVFSFGSPE